MLSISLFIRTGVDTREDSLFYEISSFLTYSFVSKVHVAVVAAEQNTNLWVIKKTHLYLKKKRVEGIWSCLGAAEGQASLLCTTDKIFKIKFCHCSFTTFLLLLLFVRNLLHEPKNISSRREGRSVYSGSRRQVLSASLGSSSWEEDCES